MEIAKELSDLRICQYSFPIQWQKMFTRNKILVFKRKESDLTDTFEN